ncbi:MAG: hypothetical protein ACRERV_11075 [Methylococcales bacterium]
MNFRQSIDALKNDGLGRTYVTVKQQLITEIEHIDNPIALVQIFEFMQLIKQNIGKPADNLVVSQYAGCLNGDDAIDMRDNIAKEFDKIEGEW